MGARLGRRPLPLLSFRWGLRNAGRSYPARGSWRSLLTSGRGRCSHAEQVLHRRTAPLSWDDLDAQGCGPEGAPDWSTLTVVGPVKRTDGHGHTALQWTVTVDCRPEPRP